MRRGAEFAIGWNVGGNPTAIVLQTSSGNMVAAAFIASAEQVQTVRLPIVAVAGGGIPAGDLRCRIVPGDAANNYLPDMSNVIATGTSQNDANAAGMFVNVGNFSTHTLTPGTRYWLVFDNLNSTGTASVQPTEFLVQSGYNLAHAVASFSAGAWSYNGTARRLSEQVEFSNSDIIGAGLLTTGVADALTVYGSRMSGVRVSLGSVGYRITGVSWYGSRNGNGCSIVTRVLDLSNNVLATSHTVFGAQQSGSSLRPWYFSSPVELQPNTTYRIALANPAGDGNSGNNFRLTFRVRAYSSEVLEMLQAGMFQNIQSSDYDGSSWSDDTAFNMPRIFLLVLDPEQPFIVPSGGGGGAGVFVPMTRVIT